MSNRPGFEPEPFTLKDGTQLTLRSIRPDDATRLQALHSRLSTDTLFLRFLSIRRELPRQDAERLAQVDYDKQMAIVATLAENGEESIVAVARYAAKSSKPDEAEAAIVVEDRFQGRGLGNFLLERLVSYAREYGFRYFFAEVSAMNNVMLKMIQRANLHTEMKLARGIWEIRVQLNETI